MPGLQPPGSKYSNYNHQGKVKMSTSILSDASRVQPPNISYEYLLELSTVGIYGFPITRSADGKITHPNTYTDYKNAPTDYKLHELIREGVNSNGIAVVAGFNNLCCVDFDLKNTSDKGIFERWKSLISPETLDKCFIESTRSKGFHVFFFCPEFQYDALPAASEDGRAVIEFFCKQNKIIYTYPTPGYTEVNISLFDIGVLTIAEATNLLKAAELFNCFKGKTEKHTTGIGRKLEYPTDKISLFEDFDLRVNPLDILTLFCKKTGWTIEYKPRRKEYELWHPATSSTARSAVYFEKTNRLICFSESQHLFPSWMQFDESKPTPYIVTPTHILYRLFDNDFVQVEIELKKLLPARISFKIRRWLLTYIEKDYVKRTIDKFGQRRIAGTCGHTIFVDSYLLVYLMHLIDPAYTWTCEGYSDEYFNADDCKSFIPDGAIVGFGCRSSILLDKTHHYPFNWNT